jgi:hypothetical protein
VSKAATQMSETKDAELNAVLPEYQRLSELLNELPVTYRTRFIRHYQQAIREGELVACVLAEKFTYQAGRSESQTSNRTCYDEAVLVTPQLPHWLAKTKLTLEREAQRSKASRAGRIAVTLEELLSGQVDLQELAQANRKLKTPPLLPKRRPAKGKPVQVVEHCKARQKSSAR